MRSASPTIAAMAAGKTVSAGVTVPTNSTMPNHLAPMASTGSFGAAARSSSPTQIAPNANSTKSATATAKTNTVAAHRTRKMVRTIMPVLVRQGLALSRRAQLRQDSATSAGIVMASIEFWYEFASTYSYPAALRIERLAEKAGVELRWRPFLLGPIFQTLGWNDSPFNIFAAKGRYMWRDLERVCEAEGLPLRLPPVKFPQNGLKAARIALVGEGEDWTPSFTR